MDRVRPGTARRLIDFVEDCSDLGVTWSLNKVLLIRLTKGSETLYVVGVTPDGLCEVPWHIGGAKNSFRVFAETLAAGISDAIFYETPRTWTVSKPGKKRLDVLELLDAAPVVREALARLNPDLKPNPLRADRLAAVQHARFAYERHRHARRQGVRRA